MSDTAVMITLHESKQCTQQEIPETYNTFVFCIVPKCVIFMIIPEI